MRRAKVIGTVLSAFLLSAMAVEDAAASVTFFGDWTGLGSEFVVNGPMTGYLNGAPIEWQAGYGPNHWLIIREKALGRIVPIVDPTSPDHRTAIQVTVLPGDNVGYTGERAEVADMIGLTDKHFDVTAATGREFYALAVKTPTNWRPPTRDPQSGQTWGLVLQLHGPDVFDAPPSVALAVEGDYHINLCSGDLLQGGALAHNKNGTSIPLSNGALHPGAWVDFVMDVSWASGPTGHLIVYRRDAGATAFVKVLDLENIATLQTRFGTPSTQAHYWKMGYYRSPSAGVTSQLMVGPLARGTAFNDVVTQAFGK